MLKDKLLMASVVIASVVLGVSSAAFATADSDAVAAVSTGTDTLGDTVKAVALYALPIAAGVLAIKFGWRMARRFIN